MIQLIQCKDWSVFANKLFADVASAANSDSTLHAHFKGHDDVIMGIVEFV
jgi:hypothetical protein